MKVGNVGDNRMKKILEIKNLTKYYGEVLAVDDLSLSLNEGEVFGFIGPNGAGKSTTIRSIMNLVNKNKGEVLINDEVFDKDNIELKKLIGYLSSEIYLYDDFSVREMLDYAYDKKILMGAICASPYVVFEEFGYLNNKKATVNPAFFNDMKNALLIKDSVVCDENIITSQGPGTTHEFAKAFIKILKSEDTANELICEMLYK